MSPIDKMTKMPPIISVIIPVYNTAPWLRRCLDSVCAQNLEQVEIICVDDASTDGSDAILEEYAAKDSRVLPVFLGRNLGASTARNVGLAIASGVYLSFLDSDDAIDKSFLQQLAVSGSETGADIVKGIRVDFFPDGSVYIRNSNEKIKINKMKFVSEWQSAIYKREFLSINNLKFDITQLIDNDAIFMSKAAAFSQSIIFNDTAKYFCYKREISLFQGPWGKEKLDARLSSMKKIADFCNTIDLSEEEYKFIMLYCMIQCRNVKFERNANDDFIYSCSQAMRYIFSICKAKNYIQCNVSKKLFEALSAKSDFFLVDYLSRNISLQDVQMEDAHIMVSSRIGNARIKIEKKCNEK